MHKIKVFAGDTRLKDIFPYATKWEVVKFKIMRFFRKVLLVSFGLGLLYGSFTLGKSLPEIKTVYAQVEIPVKDTTLTPILVKIANCESGGKQFTDKGNIVRGKVNPNDIGKFQINELYYYDVAKKMNMDIFTEEGNTKFAQYLYETRGTVDWSASQKCWSK